MFLASFACGPWQANCYLLAERAGGPAVVIDPGIDSAQTVRQVVDEHRLRPVAVLATHGHVDHIGQAAEVADGYGAPVWIDAADEHLLTDPVAGLGPDSAPLLAQLLPDGLARPKDVRLYEGETLELAGLELALAHAPGHTPGCVMLSVPCPDEAGADELVFTGDVLFAGSIGRTDLPGGDMAQMRRSLAGPVLAIRDSAAILPGHGPQSFMGRERATNPYLQPGFLAQGEA
ncbi:MAG: MBL fold metallo-hydrolase [Propionibacteriaceae bacterium]|nr:MBL fold metallo-hydrolase [Propionibacteriaceae bacterium]